MKKVFIITLLSVFMVACGGNDNEIVDQDKDKVLAVDDSYESLKNKSLTISDFLSNDTYPASKITISFDAKTTKNGAVTKNGSSFTYAPASNFTGNDAFTYTICNEATPKSCATATITITVKDTGSSTGSFNIPSEIASYYSDVDFSLTGNELKDVLATKIISTHKTNLSYTPGVWNVLKEGDLDPADNTKVLLIYGYNDNDNNTKTDRTRDKNRNGGGSTDWNREHVYPKSLGNPNLGTSGPGADAHHLRASDVRFNSERGSKKFAKGTGNAGNSSGGWYPGDEWKGDVARMMMYMYLRYGNQCLPKNVAIGETVTSDANMIKLLLDWNAQDPISEIEKQRNKAISKAQGNRNPFIDNPYLATVIFGGETAENRWK